jgi:uncharacterized protein involved in exopolysaccharide biosynthesis
MSSRTTTGGSVREVCLVLLRHKGKSLLLFVSVVAAVAVVTLLWPKEYRSVGKLFVRLGRENAMLDPAATLGQNPIVAVPQSRENEINSVVEIMQSRALLEKVVDRLGPAVILDPAGKTQFAERSPPGGAGVSVGRENSAPPGKSAGSSGLMGGDSQRGRPAAENKPNWAGLARLQINQICEEGTSLLTSLSSSAGLDDRERAILQLTKKIHVDAAKHSNVVEVSCEGPTPAQCQAVVAKLIDAFLEEHLRLNRTNGSYEFFVAQTRRLGDNLARKETELRDLKNRTGLASPAAQRQLVVARIGRLQDDLLQAEAAHVVAQARVQKLREKLASLPNTQVTAETSGLGNEGTDRMREQFFILQVREKEAQAKFTDAHPKMQQMHEQVATARSVLDEEERGRKHVTKEPARLYQQAQLALLSEEPALASLQAQAEQLRGQLGGVRQELAALNEHELRIAALQREIDLLETDYRKYSANTEQSRIDQQLEAQHMSNVGVVQPASYEPRPVRPRMMMNLLLGISAGLFGGLALPLVVEQFGGPPAAPPEGQPEPETATPAAATPRKSRQLVGIGRG